MLPVVDPPLEDGVLIIRGERIVYLGKTLPRDLPVEGPSIQLERHILLPALINAHTHLELSSLGNREWKDRSSFTEWIQELVLTIRGWGEEEFIGSIKRGIEEHLNNGILALGDISATGLSFPLLAEAGLAGLVYQEVLGFSPSVCQERLKALEERVDRCHPSELLRPGLSPHSPYSSSPQLLREVYRMARQRNLPLAIHLAETQEEIEFLLGEGGAIVSLLKALGAWDDYWQPPMTTPVGYLAQLGILEGITAIHLNHLTEEDLNLLRDHRVKVVYCPKSNLWFRRSLSPPLPQLLDQGLIIGLGTDSLASNDSLNILEELRQLKSLFPTIPNQTLIRMATLNGAHLLGLADRLGSLEPNKYASLIGLEMDDTSWDPLDYIIHRAKSPSFVMLKGRIIRCAGRVICP